MFKPLIAGVAALSLVFSTAAPAQANGLTQDDIGKILFGLAAIAAIGTIVEKNESRQSVAVTRTQRSTPTPRAQQAHRPTRVDRSVLPRNCLRSFETRFGAHRMFGARCLRNNYVFADNLPRSCAVRIMTFEGARRGYDPACLRGQGFSARR